jgi:hypothetical protein
VIRVRILLIAIAAGLALVVSPAVAHDEAPPPPGTRAVKPAAPGVTTGTPSPHASSGTVSLRRLAARATLIVEAHVRTTESLDEGRLLRHHLDTKRVLSGRPTSDPTTVIEIRGTTSRPPMLSEGEHVVVLLAPAKDLTYLRQHLGSDERWDLVGGRDGIIPVASPVDLDEVAEILAAGRAADSLPEGAERRAALRRLAFRELGTGSARLRADGLTELRQGSEPLVLTSEEIATLAAVLRDTSTPAPLRIGLLRLLGERGWDGAVAALTGAEADTPEVLRALLAARAQLGAPANREEIQRLLASQDPAVRVAAIEGLAQLDDPGVIGELGRYATADDAVPVRAAAIEALGRSHRPEAVPVLSQTFSSDDRTIKQASARALLELGEPADQALIDLALEGDTSETRRYAALILVVGRGREHPSVQRLLSHDLDPAVAKLLNDGLHSSHAHEHD